MESLELFAREILPEFKERDPAHQEAKAARYAPIIEAAFARKAATVEPTPPMPDGYSMKAIPKQLVEMAQNEQGEQWLEKIADVQATGDRDEAYEKAIFGR